jgi:hypothetical protein
MIPGEQKENSETAIEVEMENHLQRNDIIKLKKKVGSIYQLKQI